MNAPVKIALPDVGRAPSGQALVSDRAAASLAAPRFDPSRNWYYDPTAQALIASCVKRRPFTEVRRNIYAQTVDVWIVYVGSRIAMLGAIRNEFASRIMTHCDRTGDYTPFERLADDTVEAVVDCAIARHEAKVRLS